MNKRFEIELTGLETTNAKIKITNTVSELNLIKKEDIDSSLGFMGYVFTKDKPNDNNTCYLKSNNDESINIPVYTEPKGKVLGYVKCKNGGYIGVCKKSSMIIPFMILFGGLVIGGLSLGLKTEPVEQSKPSKDLADTVVSDGIVSNNDKQKPVDAGMIAFAGYSLVYASEEEPYILLENPAANDVYFTYTIVNKNTNEVILDETGLIAPGTAYQWDAKSDLEMGQYDVLFKVKTYDTVDTNKEYTPVELDNITVKIY